MLVQCSMLGQMLMAESSFGAAPSFQAARDLQAESQRAGSQY